MSGARQVRLDPALIARFSADLDPLVASDARLGVAVSGGPDSLALLFLAAAARPDQVEAATVDHQLRPEAAEEAQFVADVCTKLGLSHRTLPVQWREKPTTALQEQARSARYALLAKWAQERGLDAVLTGHHRDDQAETVLMRLTRGSGVTGLAGIRALSRVPASDIPLIRPLLGWSRQELAAVCAAQGVEPVSDRSNDDGRFERVRVRKALAGETTLDPDAIAAGARHLGDADDALAWAAAREWDRAVVETEGSIRYQPSDAPAEIRRRIIARGIGRLATEGAANPLRGSEIDRVLAALAIGETVTLRGVMCTGGPDWRLTRAPERRF